MPIEFDEDELPYFWMDEIYEVFGYKNVQGANIAARYGTFPVATYKIGNKRVADREVVRAFFRAHRQLGEKVLRERLFG